MKLSIFKSTINDGIMSNDPKYFPNLSHNEIELIHKTNIDRFLNKTGFNDNLIIINENNKEKVKVLTSKTIKTKSKIVILKESLKNTIVGVEAEDDPVIIATTVDEKGISTSAIALGTLDNLKNNLLTEIVDSLIKETDKAPFEMTFYIGACPSEKYYEVTHDIASIDIFKNAIIKRKKKYYLDLRLAIFTALRNEIGDPNMMYFDSTDTVENNNYFSKFTTNSGKNLICIKYIED